MSPLSFPSFLLELRYENIPTTTIMIIVNIIPDINIKTSNNIPHNSLLLFI